MLEFIEDIDNRQYICKSEKFVSNIIIEKSNDGFVFFCIRFEQGSTPTQLSGRYLTVQDAKKAVTRYVNNAKESKAARTAYFNEKREERKLENAAKGQPKGRKHLREGSDN